MTEDAANQPRRVDHHIRFEPGCATVARADASNGAGRMSESKSTLIRLRDWLASHLIACVPDEIAHCEFGCRKGQCTDGEWETCANRARTALRLSLAESAEGEE